MGSLKEVPNSFALRNHEGQQMRAKVMPQIRENI